MTAVNPAFLLRLSYGISSLIRDQLWNNNNKKKKALPKLGFCVASMRGSRIWMILPDWLDIVSVCVARSEIKSADLWSAGNRQVNDRRSLGQFVGANKFSIFFFFVFDRSCFVLKFHRRCLLQTGSEFPIGRRNVGLEKDEFRASYREPWLKFTERQGIQKKRGRASFAFRPPIFFEISGWIETGAMRPAVERAGHFSVPSSC